MPRWFIKFVNSCVFAGVVILLFPQTGFSAANLNIGGTGAALGTMRMLGEAYSAMKPGVQVNVAKSLGSGGGIRAVIAGAVDIGLSSRALKPREIEAGAKEIAYARSPFVLVTNKKREGIDISTDRIVDIYSGMRTTWEDGTRVRIILRPKDDTDSKLLKNMFPGIGKSLIKALERQGIPTAISDQEAMDLAERIEGSLTTATYTAVMAENRALSPVTIDGVAPTLENLANGSYRVSKTLRIIVGSKTRETVRDFIRFVRSEAGAKILRKVGNQPL